MIEEAGGNDLGPAPHDLFDASLAACKTLTAHWYAKHIGLALESVEARVERDDSKEREGIYKLSVHMTYHGAMTEAERNKLHAAVTRCPVHRLMTTSEVVIETLPL
jgi:putative redox protein